MTGAAAVVANGRLDVARQQRAVPRRAVRRLRRRRRPAEPGPLLLPRPALARASTTAGRRSPTPPCRSCAREAGRDPHDRGLTDLVGELATRSEEFRTRWARHDVRLHTGGTKVFHHPVVGDLTLDYNTLPLPADPGLSLTAYTAEPGTPSAERLALLASWAATPASDRVRTTDA